MSSQIVGTYTLTNEGNLSNASISTRLAAAPLDVSLLSNMGLRLVSDVTLTLVRTITVAMDATVPATFTASLFGGDPSGSPVAKINITAQGRGYVRPPTLAIGGSGSGAKAIAQLGVVQVDVGGGGGAGYGANTTIEETGGELAQDGVRATYQLTIALGVITGVTVLTPGGPYNVPPTLTLVDTGGGTGATLTAELGVTAVKLVNPGEGYVGATPVGVTPYFKMLYPDAAGPTVQASAIDGFMTAIIEGATNSPVTQTTLAS